MGDHYLNFQFKNSLVEVELKKAACRAKAVKAQAEKMSVDFLQQLLTESSSLEIQGESLFIQIAGIIQAATDWEHNAARILSTGATVSEFEEAIRLSKEMQAILPSLDDVLAANDVAKSWLNNSAPFMESSHSALHLSNSPLKVEKLKELVSESKLLKVFLGERSTLEIILFTCEEWELEACRVLLNVKSFLTTSGAALTNDGLQIKMQDLIISLDAVLNSDLSLAYDFCEIPRLRNAHSVLSWCHSVISITSSSPSVQEVESLLKIQGQKLFSFIVGDIPSTLLEGLKWMKKGAEIIYAPCKYELFNLCDIEETLAERQRIPLLFPEMDGKLAEVMIKHRLWLEKARQFLDLEASRRSWKLLLQIQATGKTDAFNCLELFTILSEVERVENWRYQLREVMGISSSDSNSLIDSMDKIRRTLDKSMNVYDKSRGCRMHNLCMHCSGGFEDDQLRTCSMCKDCYHEQCLGLVSFNEKHDQELCSFCQLSECEFDLQIAMSHLEHQEKEPSLDVFSKLAADAEKLFIRIEERDPLKLLLESANSCRECLTQITDFVMESSDNDFGIVTQKLIIALKAVSVAGIHDRQGIAFLELAFRRYGWRIRTRRVVQGLQKPNIQHVHTLLKEGKDLDISPKDPCWHKLVELKNIALQWSKTAKKVASDSGACDLEQVFEVIFQGENLPVNVEKQLKLLRTRSILYCICRKPYDRIPMIACDQCREWYHFACVKLHSVPKNYTCPACKHGEESLCQKPLKIDVSTSLGVIESKTPCTRDRLIKEKLEVGYSEELVSSPITDDKSEYFYAITQELGHRGGFMFCLIGSSFSGTVTSGCSSVFHCGREQRKAGVPHSESRRKGCVWWESGVGGGIDHVAGEDICTFRQGYL
ncbi:hypothetical protein MLD38_039133 [Melastoma candidum]|uniref:Uncharacterized protein n=1 Tax=Melastoma candidum TaxID=119954 RepID=A0ACB9L2C3_9MYRT|nr:hypothetical protein MLD38_039133 [Melastoma candidum]